jgi:hypothetical protein
MIWPFKKKKKQQIPFELLSSSSTSTDESMVSNYDETKGQLTCATQYTVNRESNGYSVNHYMNGNRGMSYHVNRLFLNEKQAVDYVGKKLDELEREIEILKLKQ